MDLFLWGIPVFFVLCCVALYVKSGHVINPVSVIVGWWCFWLVVANVNPVGLYLPSGYTQFLYLLMLGSVTAGALLSKALTTETPEAENERILRKWRWVVIGLVPLFVVISLLFYKAYSTYLTNPLGVSRSDIFSTGVLFPNSIASLVYTSITRPILLAGAIASITFLVLKRRKYLVVIVVTLYMMDAIMMFGRKDIYLFIFLSFLILFVSVGKSAGSHIARIRRLGMIVVIGLSSIVILVTVWRLGDTFDVGSVVERYVVQYHTGGFTVFDQERLDPDSRLNEKLTLGRASLGTIEKSTVILLFRKVDPSVQSVVNENGAYLSKFRRIGYGEAGEGVYLNAFNTILYTMYMDGREVYVILLSMLFGYFMMGHYLAWKRQRRAHSLMVSSLLAGIAFIGLFNSPLMGAHLWGTLIVFLVVNRVRLDIPVWKRAQAGSS